MNVTETPTRSDAVRLIEMSERGFCLFVGISLSVGKSVSTKLFHTYVIPETSNKTMGMKTFPEDFAASDLSKHYIL